MIRKTLIRAALLSALGVALSGCLAAAVVGTAVGVTGAVVGAGVKATGAVVGAVIPNGDDGEERDER